MDGLLRKHTLAKATSLHRDARIGVVGEDRANDGLHRSVKRWQPRGEARLCQPFQVRVELVQWRRWHGLMWEFLDGFYAHQRLHHQPSPSSYLSS
jgi:hypothetical protein